ncbi:MULTISPECIES: ComF family protein [unclassified Myroides]|uniref:ComF family protein n=1 Tax=unclassified Myroides TaxID=2642485 RepID=UPI003D2F64E4
MLKNLLNLLFPISCCGCGVILLKGESFLCTACRAFLPFTNQHQSDANEAMGKFYGKVNITRASCLLYYTKNGRVSHLFHQLKYGNQPQISYFLGKMYAEILSETAALKTIDWIIPVPMYPKKRKQRGYNQVDGFATALAEYYGIPINRTLLTKISATPSQTTKSFRERINAQTTVFYLTPAPEYTGKHFLLLDDILTTGTTLETCAKLLLQIPQSKVSILCLAYTK